MHQGIAPLFVPLLLLGCATTAEPEPAAPEPAAQAQGSPQGRRVRRGDDYIPVRPTAPVLAALVPREPSGPEADARALRAFAALPEKEQRDLLEWFTVECEKLRTTQGTLIEYVLDNAVRPEEEWPALAPLTWYDDMEHTPANPIPRVPLVADAPEVVGVRNKILAAVGTRRLDSGWMVDYAARGLVRLPHQDSPERVFRNALLGMLPDWDLAEALVELSLDDGSLQKSFAAFGHAYTDRWGGVYPGVTLYDAYASLTQVEMPDVDTLGVLHELTGDWTTFVAPVPGEQHEPLYARIGELFKPLLRHRGLRTNLARTYLCGNAELRDFYANNLDNFHALWESVASDPNVLREQLPADSAWREYLQGWDDSLQASPELFSAGARRHAALDREAHAVRATLLRLLDEYGAIQRIETLPAFDE
jgi:hypothetical protein